MIDKKLFTNSDLVGGVLTYNHNKGRSDVIPSWFDENGVERSTFDLFTIVDANTVTLATGTITGTHKLILKYDANKGSVDVFSLPENNNPDPTNRLVYGKEGTPSKTISFNSLTTWMQSKLGFLKVSENLNDLNNKVVARESIGVYSKEFINSELNKKASLLQTGSGAALGINNEAVYVPDPDKPYNPATVNFVNQQIEDNNKFLLSGEQVIGDIGNGWQEWTISLPSTLPTSNYMVVPMLIDRRAPGDAILWAIREKTTTYFKLLTAPGTGGTNTQDVIIHYVIFSI